MCPPPPSCSKPSLCGGGDNGDDLVDDGDGDDDGVRVSVEVVSKKGKLGKRRRIMAVLEGVKRDRGEVIRDTLDSAQLRLCLSILSLLFLCFGEQGRSFKITRSLFRILRNSLPGSLNSPHIQSTPEVLLNSSPG